jgi:hypothetical protein
MAALFVSGLMVYMIHFGSLTRKRRIFNSIVSTVVVSLLAVSIIYIFFHDSFLVLRLENIFSGNDTSGKGRTYDAFFLANKLLQKRNEYWGVGLGQIKIIGAGILRDYYMFDYYVYGQDFVASIPNAAAETLAVFGWVGFVLRLFAEIFFFFYTKTWTNYFRLWLFLFVFIYQFTGSFITNVAEYVIWLLAFTNVFFQFDVRKQRRADIIPLLQPRVELPG